MPPTESALLITLLLHPAPLPTVLPLDAFASFFPSSLRSNPQIAHLYRSVQYRRALALDLVRSNIDAEARRGESMRREVVRQARKDAEGRVEGELEREWAELGLEEEDGSRGNGLAMVCPHFYIFVLLSGITLYSIIKETNVCHGSDVYWKTTGSDSHKPHTLETIVPALESACKDVDVEVAALEAEAQRHISELNAIVGDLSDLRYGRFAKDAQGRDVSDEAMDALKDLQSILARETP